MPVSRIDRLAITIILSGLMVRLLLAQTLPLSADEAYAVAASREFSISFFDHPPISFWMAQAGAMVFGEHALAYRLPFVAMGLGTAILIWTLGRRLGGAEVGLWSLILWQITPHFVGSTGIYALPEGPLSFFSLAALVVLTWDIGPDQDRPRAGVWLLAGVFLGLAMATKYNAALLALGVFGYLLTSHRHRSWLWHWQPWAGAALGLLGLVPVLWFNARVDWASFRFHGARTGGAFDPGNLAQMYLGQAQLLGYFTGLILILGLVSALRAGSALSRLLLWAALTGMLAFAPIFAFGTYTYAWWTMPGWLIALPLAAQWLCAPARRKVWFWATGVWGAAIWAVMAVGFHEMATGNLSRLAGRQVLDTKTLAYHLDDFRRWLTDRNLLQGASVIAVDRWGTGALISTLLQGQYGIQVLGPDARHFQFHRAADAPRATVFVVMEDSTDRAALEATSAAVLSRTGATATATQYFDILHGGQPLASIAVHRLAW